MTRPTNFVTPKEFRLTQDEKAEVVANCDHLAKCIGVEALIGEEETPAKRGPTPKLQRHLERISTLPKPKQRAVMEVLEAVLAQAGRS